MNDGKHDMNDGGRETAAKNRASLAAAWLAAEPDEQLRSQLELHLNQHSNDDTWLAEHFDVPLRFGTAGLRGPMGVGPACMNRLTVRLAARAVAQEVLAQGLAARGVVIGFDARYDSDNYALDSARVLTALGVPTALINGVVPTPVLARQLLARQAGAAIMVTASHNPRDDNGYKVYWSDGTQIRPPIDELIEARIATQLRSADLVVESDLAPRHEVELIEPRSAIADYVGAAIVPFELSEEPAGDIQLELVYTALCGVGTDTLKWAFSVAGLPPPVLVTHQCQPDPTFKGLRFPNPEEPGTLDAATALAEEHGIDLVLANDPDADRLAVAVRTPPDASGVRPWRRLTGDELGVLLCDRLISQAGRSTTTPEGSTTTPEAGREQIAASSVVSGSMVEALCAAHSVTHHRTLTGFKWVMQPRLDNPAAEWVFGYEEALGYSVNDAVLDKDGISAAVEFVRLARHLAARGIGPLERLDELAQELGVFETLQISVRSDASAIAEVTDRLRADPPVELGDRTVSAVTDWHLLDTPLRTDLLEIRLDSPASPPQPTTTPPQPTTTPPLNRRIFIRPSGTEPKVKLYLEVSTPGPVRATEIAELRTLCAAELNAIGNAARNWFN